MSDGEVVSVRGGVGGITAEVQDLRSCALALYGLGSAVQAESDDVAALGRLVAGGVVGDLLLDVAGVCDVEEFAGQTTSLGKLLWQAADNYEDADGWTLGRVAGLAWSVAKDIAKPVTWALSGGEYGNWRWDTTPLEPLTGLVMTTGVLQIARGFALLLDWRGATATPTGLDTIGPATVTPRNLMDLAGSLEYRNRQEPGAIDIQIQEFDDGRPRKVVVNIPGTSTVLPSAHTPTDITADVVALFGTRTAYSAGIIEAMELAGVAPEDEVLLVGHSQGGLIAAQLADELTESGRFTVTDILTFGAPVAKIQVPPSVRVLAVENRFDPVVSLDGGRNADRPNVVTVTVDTGEQLLDAHTIDQGYLPALDELAASDDPSAKDAVQHLDPYLCADRVSVQTFTISRSA